MCKWRATRLLAVGLLAGCVAPFLPAQTSSDLDLQIRPQEIKAGVPQAFTFLITNHSQHTIHIANPTLECSSSFDGTVWLRMRFTPLNPASGKGLGRGCAADKWGWPPIQERVEEWRTLEPGQSITLRANKQDLFYDDLGPGSYEFWAEYVPPYVSDTDQQTLREERVTTSLGKMVSQHVIFRKPN